MAAMRSFLYWASIVVGGVVLAVFIDSISSKRVPLRENKACLVAHQLNLENPEYLELTTGWGFTPDTCSVQAATMQGMVRVPTVVWFCVAGLGVPECKVIFDLQRKKPERAEPK
jgi:hypothetical protein